MNRAKTILLVAMGVAVLMVLFPPWSVRQRLTDRGYGGFGPERAAGYRFIAMPPNKTRYDLLREIATVDLSRLLLQFVALGLVTGGSIVAVRMLGTGAAEERTIRRDQSGAGGTRQEVDGAAETIEPMREPRRCAEAGPELGGAGAPVGRLNDAAVGADAPIVPTKEIQSAFAARGSSQFPVRTSADETVRRWPWKRLARWTYNWYLLLSICIVFGGLNVLGHWGKIRMDRQANSLLDGVQPLLVLGAIMATCFIGLLIWLLNVMKKQIDEAASLLQWVFIAACIVDIGELVVMKTLPISGAVLEAATVQVVALTFFRLAICLPLLRPLVRPRFRQFSLLLNALKEHGVPRQFMLKGPPPASCIIQPDEPTVRLSWPKLVRAIAVGKVNIPERVCFGGPSNERTRVAA